jgi:hypothetical protein
MVGVAALVMVLCVVALVVVVVRGGVGFVGWVELHSI